MRKCSNCSNRLNSKDIIISIWLKGYSPILCENCNTKYHVNTSTRWITGLLTGGPLFIISRFIHGYNVLIVYILWMIFTFFLTPYYARYHIKDEIER